MENVLIALVVCVSLVAIVALVVVTGGSFRGRYGDGGGSVDIKPRK